MKVEVGQIWEWICNPQDHPFRYYRAEIIFVNQEMIQSQIVYSNTEIRPLGMILTAHLKRKDPYQHQLEFNWNLYSDIEKPITSNYLVNDFICPSCKNDRCSRSEKICWRCGNSLCIKDSA